MPHDFCVWCAKKLEAPESYDKKKQMLYCSTGCFDAELLFRVLFDDSMYVNSIHKANLNVTVKKRPASS